MNIAAIVGPVLVVLAMGSAFAQGEIVEPAPCNTPEDMLSSSSDLPRIGRRVRDGAPILIVALGSSSTSGSGASTPGSSYPSQLQQILQQSLPNSQVQVANKGVPGERAHEMVARFGRDVIDLHPDLLIWQTGTNSVVNNADVGGFAEDLSQGIAMSRAAGIDLVILTPQYAPAVTAAPKHSEFLARIEAIAAEAQVPLFRRFEIMRHWQENENLPAAGLTGPDGLHSTDLGYKCLARSIARMIVKLASPAEHPRQPAQIVDMAAKSLP